MKYYIISGEASGDLHGSSLIRELKQIDSEAQFRCWGGDLMKAEGGVLVKHYKDLAFMGFTEVVMHIGTIIRNLKFCKLDILTFQPDVLILIDYPGFNMRIAEFASEKGIRIFYYISPQIWAWNQNRVYKLKQTVDRMFVILPFEKDFYKKFGMDVSYHGHPLIDKITGFEKDFLFFEKNGLDQRPTIALLPGSRKQEIKRMLPVMIDATIGFSDHQIVVAGVSSIEKEFYHQIAGDKKIHLVYDQTYNLILNSRAVAVTSGTATLETGLLGVPLVVCYKGNFLSYFLAKKLIKVKYISLVNLVLDRFAVPELIQDKLTIKNLKNELYKLLPDGKERDLMISELKKLKEMLGDFNASKRIAQEMFQLLKTPKK